MGTHQTCIEQPRLGTADTASQRSGSKIMKLETWSETGRGTYTETVYPDQGDEKQYADCGLLLVAKEAIRGRENPQRKMMDSAFSTVKWRAMDTGIKRRKALKSDSGQWRREANNMWDAYMFQKVRASNHGTKALKTP